MPTSNAHREHSVGHWPPVPQDFTGTMPLPATGGYEWSRSGFLWRKTDARIQFQSGKRVLVVTANQRMNRGKFSPNKVGSEWSELVSRQIALPKFFFSQGPAVHETSTNLHGTDIEAPAR